MSLQLVEAHGRPSRAGQPAQLRPGRAEKGSACGLGPGLLAHLGMEVATSNLRASLSRTCTYQPATWLIRRGACWSSSCWCPASPSATSSVSRSRAWLGLERAACCSQHFLVVAGSACQAPCWPGTLCRQSCMATCHCNMQPQDAYSKHGSTPPSSSADLSWLCAADMSTSAATPLRSRRTAGARLCRSQMKRDTSAAITVGRCSSCTHRDRLQPGIPEAVSGNARHQRPHNAFLTQSGPAGSA